MPTALTRDAEAVRADRRALLLAAGTVMTAFAVGAAVQTAWVYGNQGGEVPVTSRILANLTAVASMLLILAVTGVSLPQRGAPALVVGVLSAGVTASGVRFASQPPARRVRGPAAVDDRGRAQQRRRGRVGRGQHGPGGDAVPAAAAQRGRRGRAGRLQIEPGARGAAARGGAGPPRGRRGAARQHAAAAGAGRRPARQPAGRDRRARPASGDRRARRPAPGDARGDRDGAGGRRPRHQPDALPGAGSRSGWCRRSGRCSAASRAR